SKQCGKLLDFRIFERPRQFRGTHMRAESELSSLWRRKSLAALSPFSWRIRLGITPESPARGRYNNNHINFKFL
ncbi:MAG: hypothetical protein OXB87_03345, partial [Hyphomicrobiales bacterium]|nr:hypothetical protein [Hyphomicrobiales bacterium]